MANAEAVSGVHSYLLYGKESTYNTAVAVTTHLGLVSSFRHNINNNMQEQRAFVGTTTGGRDIVKFTYGKLELGGSVEFKVINWTFMEYVLGSVSGGGPYTYVGAAIPPSMTMAHNIDNPGSAATDREETFSGVVVNSASIRTSVGEPVTASLDWNAGLVVIDTTASSAVALPTSDIYNFSGGSIQLPSGSTLSNIIDSVEVSIANNWDMLYGLGTRLVKAARPKERSYKIKISLKYLDNTLITAALGATTPTATGGPTENATLILTFASATRSMVMTFSGVPMSDFAEIAELNSVIGEDISITAKTLSAVETAA
jgi:hypothetical protein